MEDGVIALERTPSKEIVQSHKGEPIAKRMCNHVKEYLF
jgi:hypothetical protein